MKFKLQITNGYDIKVEGVEAAELLSQFGINDNYVAGDGSIVLYFNRKEVENSKLLTILFESTNKAYLYNSLSKGNKLNKLIDIKKLYEFQHPKEIDIEQRYDKDQRGYFLKNNAKEIFYKIFNSLVEEKIYIFNNIQNEGIAGYIKKGIFETPKITFEKAGLFGIDNLEDWKKFLSKINTLYPDESKKDKQELDKLEKEYAELQEYVETLKFDIPLMLSLEKDEVTKEKKEVEKVRYLSQLDNFNGHEWVRFYEDEEGQPNVQWAEGCHDIALTGLKNFESRVEDTYGNDKNGIIYRTYMLEDDKMRLSMNLPAREIDNIIKVYNFRNLLETRRPQIEEWLKNSDSDNYFLPKNKLWIELAQKEETEFQYLDNGDNSEEENYYYDLVTVEYIDKLFAIPVPILADILQVERKNIYDCFIEKQFRNEVEFI